MGYLEDFQTQINNRDFSKFLQLWEEYCASDVIDPEEIILLLKTIKTSDFAKIFGRLVETALPLWQTIQDPEASYEVLKHLIDLQIANTPELADLAVDAIKRRHGEHPQFNERLRLIGLRNRDAFQGALSNYDLLAHINTGKFVFHGSGWGVGEIMEVSPVREQMTIEFENVGGRKQVTFSNAFKTLIPLSHEHFLSRRFADPDQLEKEAKKDPVRVIKMLLSDLGPKTAAEIKDELCELVIPEDEWTKWWQTTRAKLKKDPLIETPEGIKGEFRLRKKEITMEERLHHRVHSKTDPEEIIQTSYNTIRDFPHLLKIEEETQRLKEKLVSLLSDSSLTPAQELQVLLLLETHFGHETPGKPLYLMIGTIDNIQEAVDAIEIIALKKRVLSLIREHRQDWQPLFFAFLYTTTQSNLRDYLIKELDIPEVRPLLVKELEKLLKHPEKQPDFVVWYFQKLMSKKSENLPFSDKEGQGLFFEAFLTLLNKIETKSEHRDLAKKMHSILSDKRYAITRKCIEGRSLEFIKEFLLLASKCQVFSDHDLKILRSLAEVVHPSLAAHKAHKGSRHDPNIIWTTEAGYLKTQERAQHIGTVEVIENAREIEDARALGDLRENSEYKFALERRSRLQGELKMLSDQLKRARLITREDISNEEAGIGNIIEVENPQGEKTTYTILGPWDADPDKNILSSQSKLAQSMLGLKIGDSFTFRDEEFTVTGIRSFLDG